MARIYSHRKGKSGSHKPYRTGAPAWVKYSPEEVEQLVVKLAKEGRTLAEIGTVLRDSYGVPSVKLVTDKKVGEILREAGLEPEVPPDLFDLLEKAVKLNEHMERHPKDLHSRRGLEHTKMKIFRLVNYYKKEGRLPANWKYSPGKAKVIVSGGK